MLKFKTDSPPKSLKNSLLSPRLVTPRLMLKSPCCEDYARWSAVREINKPYLVPYEPEWSDDCLSQAFFIRRLARQEKDRREGSGVYLYLHKDGNIIGGLNLNNIQMGAAHHATLGYWLDRDYQGQGYMSEAVQAIIDYAFIRLKLKRLNAACLPDNHRSIHMLLKLGFAEEGYARKYLQINGIWQDHNLFGLCASAESGKLVGRNA